MAEMGHSRRFKREHEAPPGGVLISFEHDPTKHGRWSAAGSDGVIQLTHVFPPAIYQ
jgi:hypothetical protein